MKFLAVSLLSSSLLFGVERVEDKCALEIVTPSLQERETRKLRLDNGLEMILISDPRTTTSGAALSVEVGSWDDPKERPGMAHFVEHLLFLGTEKYPEEEGYTRYLDEHGGVRNAFTMSDRTCYMFSVNNNGFLEALDRFGHFFISPLFSPSGVERECKAIHQEYCKDIPLDPWRSLYVKKELANVEHPFHSFCIGNIETLAKISQEELKEWYKKHYSADVMHLVLYSALSLDMMEEEATALFSQVRQIEREKEELTASIFPPDYKPTLVALTPLQEIQQLELSWEISADFGKDRDSHVDKLLSYVLGHEGETSLLAQLKREHLADGLAAGLIQAGKDQGVMTINIQLTREGVERYEEVIARCWQALANFRQSNIPRFIFDEVVQIKELEYSYQSREEIFEFVAEYAVRMADEPLETFPRKSLIPSIYAPEKVELMLAQLIPQRCLYTLIAPAAINPFPTNKCERWLGAHYSIHPISPEKISLWSSATPHQEISIPAPNKFLPTHLHLPDTVEAKGLLPQTEIVLDSLQGKVYCCKDDRFFVPKVSWHFTIKTPEILDNKPNSKVLADIYCMAVNQSLNSLAYNAQLGGLSFSLVPDRDCLTLSIQGYEDKAATFLQEVLRACKTVEPTVQQFHLYKDLTGRTYRVSSNTSAIKQGAEVLWDIIYADYCGVNQKNAVLHEVTYGDLKKFQKNLFQRAYVEGTLYGNHSLNEGKEIATMVIKELGAKAFPPHLHKRLLTASLPEHLHPSYLVEKSIQPANALILTADCGKFSFERRAALDILSKGLQEPFFSELRTKQQTAYLVTNWAQEIERHLYAFFAIQSSSHETRDLLARFELFLETNLQHLADETIPEERFEAIRSSLVHKLEEPAENPQKMGILIHSLAFDYDGDFSWLDKRQEALAQLSYPEFLQIASEFLGKENHRRLAICIDGVLPETQKFQYNLIQVAEAFKKEIEYQAR
ncbi:MAG: insulinase family protein [Chlamydiales bacterium]